MAGPSTPCPQSDDRRQVDDGAPAILDHPGDCVLAGEHDALEVHVKNGVPKVFVYIGNRSRSGYTHIVDQHVDLAEVVHGGLDHGGAVTGTGNVAYEDRRFAAFLSDSRQGNVGVLLVPVHQQHLCAVPGEEDGYGLADAHENHRCRWPRRR